MPTSVFQVLRPPSTRKGICLFLALLLFCLPCWSNNHHDHIYAVPSSADFASEYASLAGVQGAIHRAFSVPRSGLDAARAAAFLETVLGRSRGDGAVLDAVDTLTANTTVAQFLQRLFPGETITGAHLGRLLTFPASDAILRMAPSDRRELYIRIEALRRNLLLFLVNGSHPRGQPIANRIFAAYFTREQLQNRGILDLSVPADWFPRRWSNRERRWFEPNGLAFLTTLHENAAQARSELKLFMSIGRAEIINGENLKRIRDDLEDLHRHARVDDRPVLGGLDIAGSISERNEQDGTRGEVERVIANFHEVFRVCGDLKLPLRIHAFEGANRGLFYEALWHAIRTYTGPELTIRIGHTNALTIDWLGDPRAPERSPERLGALRANEKIKILLESNPNSNHVLRGTSRRNLMTTLRLARQAGHTIVPGGDGAGFLPAGTYTGQRAWLEAEDQRSFDVFTTLHPLGWTCGQFLETVAGG